MAPNPSVRSQVHSAIVTLLGAISVANGYNTDLAVAAGGGGAHKLYNENSRKTPPLVFVILNTEEKISQDNQFLHCRAEFECVGEVAIQEETQQDQLAERLDLLMTDIEKALLNGVLQSPAFGVVGVEDVELGGYDIHEVSPFRASAVIFGTVQYRHRADNPSDGST